MSDLKIPELNHEQIEIWVEMLADGELTSTQRTQLYEFLEQYPEYWRCCAMAFWDSMTLKNWMPPMLDSGPASSTVDLAMRLKPQLGENSPAGIARDVRLATTRPPRRGTGNHSSLGWVSGIVISCAVGVAFCLISGFLYWGWTEASTKLLASKVQWRQDISRIIDVQELLQAELLAERSSFRSLGSLFPNQPQLIEIENTPARALFLTDRPLSPELMDWLVRYGTDVQVRPYQPQTNAALWQALRNPVLEIEVLKLSSLNSY